MWAAPPPSPAAGRLRWPVAASLLEAGLALNLLQWNPHWECFAWNKHNCKEEFTKSLASELEQGDIDFANIVEYNDGVSRLPSRWKVLENMCGIDRTSLIYNSDRWRAPAAHGSNRSGCMMERPHRDRPFIVQQFTEAAAWGGERRLIVVGAHYPHTKERDALSDALKAVVAATGEKSVVLLADTNEEVAIKSRQIYEDIEAPDPVGDLMTSKLHNTCCLNNGFRDEMTYDRIIANFGEDIITTVLFDDTPHWAQGEFHKAIRGQIVESSTKTSTTTTTTGTTTTVSTTSSTTVTTRTSTSTTATATTTTTTTTTTEPPPTFIVISVGAFSTCAVAFVVLSGMLIHKLISHNSRKSIGTATAEMMLTSSESRTVPVPIE